MCYFHLAARDRLKEAYPIVLAQNKAFTAETPLPGPASVPTAGGAGREGAEEKRNREGRVGEENDLGISSVDVFVWDGLQFTHSTVQSRAMQGG